MVKKTLIALLLCVTFTNATVGRIETFKAYPQRKSNWCWAASIQAIFLTKGLQVTQANIVTAAYGQPINKRSPSFQKTENLLNNLALSLDGSVWSIQAKAYGNFPNANWLYKKLRNDEPVMIWYRDEHTIGHSIVINGGEFNKDYYGNIYWIKIFAYDPWYNMNMIINASNIPIYLIGYFDIQVKKINNDIPNKNYKEESKQMTTKNVFQKCLDKMDQRCMNACQNKYHYSYNECRNKLCNSQKQKQQNYNRCK